MQLEECGTFELVELRWCLTVTYSQYLPLPFLQTGAFSGPFLVNSH